ncbi:hypothetical protein L1987_38117 [Smallanthus sonchifolius]|uniref:Uncharacterized protein n=1 Tax=Smallanthus sonchifolius TaxID=185202 RepID=A0ACB9HKT8_9ASTR|nr:hypothetical protein L1987_38117 [Smallanthus sonchifolius]
MYLRLPPNPQYTLAFIRFPLIRYDVSHSLLLHLRRRVPQPSTPLTSSCPPAFYSAAALPFVSTENYSPRDERGPASLSTKKDASAYHIEFDNDMQPIGPNAYHFSSCIGMYLPYHIDMKDLTTQHWEGLWSRLKEEWHLENDGLEDLVFIKAKNLATNWRSKLVTKYVNVGTTPFAKKERSQKAKASALANKDFARLGRNGYVGILPKVDDIWSQLLTNNDDLEKMKDFSSKKWIRSTILVLFSAAESLGLPLIPPYFNIKRSIGAMRQGVNYAFVGATAVNSSFIQTIATEDVVLNVSCN